LNKTQIYLENSTTIYPSSIIDNDQQDYVFPIILKRGDVLNITLVFIEKLTASGEYTLIIKYNNGSVFRAEFTFL
jgi:hypothetical protein